jgi:hypothetical protein
MAEASAIWAEYEISPVEVAMPGNKVGLTLRAYRLASALTPTDVSEREDDDEVFNARDARRAAVDEELPEFEWTKEQLDEIAAGRSDDELAEEAVESAEDDDDKKDDDAPLDQEHPRAADNSKPKAARNGRAESRRRLQIPRAANRLA